MIEVKITRDRDNKTMETIYRGESKKKAKRIVDIALNKIEANNYSVETVEFVAG